MAVSRLEALRERIRAKEKAASAASPTPKDAGSGGQDTAQAAAPSAPQSGLAEVEKQSAAAAELRRSSGRWAFLERMRSHATGKNGAADNDGAARKPVARPLQGGAAGSPKRQRTLKDEVCRLPEFVTTTAAKEAASVGWSSSACLADGVPQCRCHRDAMLRKVAKVGVNQGKWFFACARGREEACDFFQWSDTGGEDAASGAPVEDVAHALCKCGKLAAEKTSTKHGLNYGRPFLTCSQQRCSFFEWADTRDDDGPTVCRCGKLTAEMKVRKEGPNHGRTFHGCVDGRCDFFAWADKAAAPTTSSTSPPVEETQVAAASRVVNSQQAAPRAPAATATSGREDSTRQCRCGVAAVLRTVRKDGPNTNRRFWSCDQPDRCQFFEWDDSEAPSSGGGLGSFRSEGDSGSAVRCDCLLEAARFTVRKEGPNSGRQFWKCPKARCQFFEWLS
eukprot:TRINITY_DN29858_c0_g1_i4.p1 TRINITY_DN29858_c0_g1~~TRINITY_DN29858_c0_g1_i4.p1  ORF type:complete len:448 (-),score=84.70 TRINITY_DN29858_c0_g1_i4:96-1439(-)